MDDHGPPHLLTRRASIAGPFMRGNTQGTSPSDKPHPLASSAGPTGSGVPPPLSRANTYGGWFPSIFGRSTGSLTQSGSQLRQSNPIPIQDNHNRSMLAASTSDAISNPSSYDDSRGSLMSSEGFARAGASAGSPPPLGRRLSLDTFVRPTSGTDVAAAAAIASTSPRSGNSILETDIRQGPIETDLFWLVLRDIGE